MTNTLLGKILKSMYKLSGKTINQLSEETDLTVDTINNLFYARIQKPGFFGVVSLVIACGYSVTDLTGFLEVAKDLPDNADITEEFTKYLFSVKDTNSSVRLTADCPVSANGHVTSHNGCTQILQLNEEHERELDRFRATHLHYVDELHTRYKEQIAQMENTDAQIKAQYDRTVEELRHDHETEINRQNTELSHLKRLNCILTVAIATVCVTALVLLSLV